MNKTSCQCALDVDGPSGRVAYLAGSVVVLLDDDGNQTHIVNETKKAFTSVAFSVDGKSLLTGKHLWLIELRVRDLWQSALFIVHPI